MVQRLPPRDVIRHNLEFQRAMTPACFSNGWHLGIGTPLSGWENNCYLRLNSWYTMSPFMMIHDFPGKGKGICFAGDLPQAKLNYRDYS